MTPIASANHLACPVDGTPLYRDGESLVAASGRRYPPAAGSWDLRSEAADANNVLQAEIYDAKVGEFSDLDHAHNLMLVHQRHLLEALSLKPGERVLEMGAHRSGVLPWLERTYGIVGSGVDIAAGWVNAQNLAAVRRSSATRWYVADAEQLPFADASFSAVIAFDVLEHVTDLDRALRACARVLRPGGRLVCHLPVRDIEGSWDGIQRWWDAASYAARQASVGHFHERLPTRRQFATHLEQVGFQLLDQQSFNVWVQPLHDHRFLGALGGARRKLAERRGRGGATTAPASAGGGPTASRFQKVYARLAVPLVRAMSVPDHVGRALGIGGSCSYIAERLAD